MHSLIKTSCKEKKRRSSIFKPNLEEQPESQLCLDNEYPREYKELLKGEIEQWTVIIQTLKKKHQDLRSKLLEPETIIIEKDVLKNEMDMFDHTLYFNYLQSVQNLCNKFECILGKKEQEKLNINNEYYHKTQHNFILQKMKDILQF